MWTRVGVSILRNSGDFSIGTVHDRKSTLIRSIVGFGASLPPGARFSTGSMKTIVDTSRSMSTPKRSLRSATACHLLL